MRKPIYINAIRVIGIAIITLALLEVSLRVAGFYYTYTEKMGGGYTSYYNTVLPTWYWEYHPYDSIIDSKPEFSYRDRANNWGFRDRDFDTTEGGHITKVLVIGDSFVQGVGTAADSTWPRYLQRRINGADTGRCRIYNCGVAGSDPFYEYVLLRDKLINLHPDMVIMSINYSDIHDYITRGGMERFRPDGTCAFKKGPWFEPLYRRSHVVRLFVHFVLRYDYSLLSQPAHEAALKDGIGKISDCAIAAQKLCTERHIKFLTVIHPYLTPYDRYVQKQDELAAIGVNLRRKNIPVVDLMGDFSRVINRSNYEEYSWPRDLHYKAKGYELFAHLVLENLRKADPKWPEGK
jgi:lysophospholipase L1-like esterase